MLAVSLRGRSERWRSASRTGSRSSAAAPARLVRELWLRSDHPDVRLLAGSVDVVHGPNYVVPPGGPAAEVVTVSDLSAIHFPEMCSPDVLQWPPLLRRALRRGRVGPHDQPRRRRRGPVSSIRRRPTGWSPSRSPWTDHCHRGRPPAAAGVVTSRAGTATSCRSALRSHARICPASCGRSTQVAADDADVRLVLVGPDGIGAAELDAAIDRTHHRDRIVRVGWVDDDSRLALLRGATVVAYPSRYEGFGLVPLEAIAAGTPVVATATGAIPEVLGDGGLLVAPGDVDALAAGLHRVLTDDQLVTTLLRRGGAGSTPTPGTGRWQASSTSTAPPSPTSARGLSPDAPRARPGGRALGIAEPSGGAARQRPLRRRCRGGT